MVWGTNYLPTHLCQAGNLAEDDVLRNVDFPQVYLLRCTEYLPNWSKLGDPQTINERWMSVESPPVAPCLLLLAQNQEILGDLIGMGCNEPRTWDQSFDRQRIPSVDLFRENDCKVANLRSQESPFDRVQPVKYSENIQEVAPSSSEKRDLFWVLMVIICNWTRFGVPKDFTHSRHSHRLWSKWSNGGRQYPLSLGKHWK